MCTGSKEPKDREGIFCLALLLVLTGGFLLRTHHCDWGYPVFGHPDSRYFPEAWNEAWAKGNFKPSFFTNPPLLVYVYAAWIAFAHAANAILEPAGIDFLWYVARFSAQIISGVFGSATVVLVYSIGRRLHGRQVGLIACSLLSFCYLAVRDSHFATNDIFSTFVATLAFRFFVEAYLRGSTRSYVASGFVAGLAVAAKYNTGVIWLSFVVASIAHRGWRGKTQRRQLVLMSLACAIGFLVACPWVLLAPAEFFAGFREQVEHGRRAWYYQMPDHPLVLFFKTYLWGYGAVPLLFAAASVPLVVRRGYSALLLTFPLLYVALLGISRLYFVRFAIPVLPFLSILSALGIAEITTRLAPQRRRLWATALTGAALLQGAVFCLRHDQLLGRADSRFIARDWLVENVPENAKVVVEGGEYGTRLRFADDKRTAIEVLDVGEMAERSLPEYLREGYEYFVVTEYIRGLHVYYHGEEHPVYRDLDRMCDLVHPAEVRAVPLVADDMYAPFWNLWEISRPGPVIWIYHCPVHTTAPDR